MIDDYTLRKKQRTSISALTPQLVLLPLHVSAEKHNHLQGAANIRHNMYSALIDDYTLRKKQRTSISALTAQLVLLPLHVSAEKQNHLQVATNVRHNMYSALCS